MKQRVNDIEIAYSDRGKGLKAVLLHGLAEDRHSFTGVQERLRGVQGFACDLRGHGETTLGNAGGTLEQLGSDLAGFLEQITGPAVCIGYSLGGTIVLWTAALRPDLVLHAVVAGTSVKVGYKANLFFRERIRLVENDPPAFAEALYQDTAAQVINKDIDIEKLTRMRLQTIGSGAGYINAARAMMRLHERPLTPLLAQIQCPVDVIGADQDLFCPPRAAAMITDALENVNYHEIANSGHLMSIDQPARYGATLQKILDRSIP